MSKYILYILKDNNLFFVGKVKLEYAKRELSLHRAGKYKDTKDWFNENKNSIKISWIETFEGTRGEAFNREIIWTRYFLDKGLTHSNSESEVVLYANNIKKTLDVKELSKEERELLNRIVDKKSKKPSKTKITVFVDKDEHKIIKQYANESGLSMSKYLRTMGLNKKIKHYDYSNITELTKKLSEIEQDIKFLIYNDYPNKELVREDIIQLTKEFKVISRELNKMFRRIK